MLTLFRQLTESERKIIGFTVENGYTKGQFNGLYWEVKLEEENSFLREDVLKFIAAQIEKGNTYGQIPHRWKLETENK